MKNKIVFSLFIILLLNVFIQSSCIAEDFGKIVVKNGKYFVIKYHKYILKNYDNIEEITNSKDNFYLVELNGKKGIMFASGAVLLKPIYDEIVNAGDNIFIVKANGKYGLYNFFDEKWEIVPHLDEFNFTTNNLYIARKNNKYGIYSSKQKDWALDLSFDDIVYENNNFCLQKSGYSGVLNQFLEVVIPLVYDEIDYDQDNFVYYVSKDDKWGITDLYGKFVLLPIYQDISLLNYNSKFVGYVVKFNEKYGILNEKARLVVPFIYDKIERISEFDDEYLKVLKTGVYGGKYGVLKYNGKKVLKCKYDDILFMKNENLEQYENDIYLYRAKNKDYVFVYPTETGYGVLSVDGKDIVYPNYQEIYAYFYNKNTFAFVVKRNNRYGVVEVDKDGVQNFKYINKPLDDIIFDEKTKIIEQNNLFKDI